MVDYLTTDMKLKPDTVDPSEIQFIFTFRDTEVNNNFYIFVKEKLDEYYLYLDDEEWKLVFTTNYDESSKILIIRLELTIPSKSISKDEVDEISKEIYVHERLFQQFYNDLRDSFIG